MIVPRRLTELWREVGDDARAWLADLPRLVSECAEQWSLDVGDPFEPGGVGWVAPASRADGTQVVLKLNFPDRESAHEADALRLLDGDGAVRLLASDGERNALLLERLVPGTQLWDLPDEDGIAIAATLLPRLWRAPPPTHAFDLLTHYAEEWAETIPARHAKLGRPFEQALADQAADLAHELARASGESVVLHQDFHQGNVLAADREPWLAIDPKPVVGDREYDVASLLADRADWLLAQPSPAGVVAARFEYLADALALDRERMRAWAIVKLLAWALGPGGDLRADTEVVRLVAAQPT